MDGEEQSRREVLKALGAAAALCAVALAGCETARYRPMSARDVDYAKAAQALRTGTAAVWISGGLVAEHALGTVLIDLAGGLRFDGAGFVPVKVAPERLEKLLDVQYGNVPDNRITAIHDGETIEALVVPRGSFLAHRDTKTGEFGVGALSGGGGGY